MELYELVIKGGLVIDPGSNSEGHFQIGIRDGKINTLTMDEIAGAKEIDASGFVVTPGFIDVHTHVDGLETAGEWSALMGVTTVIGGNCGMSHAAEGLDMSAFLKRIDQEGFPVNHGHLIGASDLREAVGVDRYSPANDDIIPKIADQAERSISQGALGVSFGLAYAPGTSEKELFELFKTAARSNVIVAVHPRYAGVGIPGFSADAVVGQNELFDVIRKTGAKLHVSHLGSQLAWKSKPYDDLLTRGLESIENAIAEGLDVTCDCHPYNAWCTKAEAAVLDQFLNPAIRYRFKQSYDLDMTSIEVASGLHRGKRLTEELFKRIRLEDPSIRLVGHMMKEDLVMRTLQNQYVMVASDSVYDDEHGIPNHPRGAGTFPRMLRRLVREFNMLSFLETLEKMTSQPADRFGLVNKGRIAVGADADLTIFDPETIEDLATYSHPDRVNKGVMYVIVNGVPVIEKGELQNVVPGQAVRSEPPGRDMPSGGRK